jgi:hypothetical protein
MTKVEFLARLAVFFGSCIDVKGHQPSHRTLVNNMDKLRIAGVESQPGTGYVTVTFNDDSRLRLAVTEEPKEDDDAQSGTA